VNSDLRGETGSPHPGVDRLFRTVTAAGTTAELAGEHEALAMFRANVRPSVGLRAEPAGSGRPGRVFRFPVRWGVRLAALAAAVAVGGTAAAAYAAVLPEPVQHLAHSVLGFAGVPDRPAGSVHGTSGHHARSPHHPPHPVLALSTPATTPSGSSAAATGTASPTPGAGALVLSATAASEQITAGAATVIDGRLTQSGAGVQGVTVTLVERLAGQEAWRVAGSGPTASDGNVAVSVPALTANAVFRLAVRGAALSPSVAVKVSPPITAILDVSSTGVSDLLVVSTEYARAGDVVVLQVQAADGSWLFLRNRPLNASGKASFGLSGKRLGDRDVRVVLLATVTHATAVSNPVMVPPPG
jgi:hypothetical protein